MTALGKLRDVTHRPQAYERLSMLQGAIYALLAVSIIVRPPPPSSRRPVGDHFVTVPSVFDQIIASQLVVALFLAVAAALVASSLLCRAHLGHMAAVPALLVFGVANLGNSIINNTGWTTACICAAAALGHGIAIRYRGLEGEDAA